jgi:hypothetical protein
VWWVGFGCDWAKLNVVFLCRQVRRQNTSFDFAKGWLSFIFSDYVLMSVWLFTMRHNGWQLQEVGDFYHKCSYEERMFD